MPMTPMTPDKPQVSIHIVAWNGMTHLQSCLQSIMNQTYQSISVMVVDNGSVDGTVPWLASEYPQVHMLRNTRNLGFCHGHNQAIRITDSPYVLCLNQDIVLTPDWVTKAVAILQAQPGIGSVGGKLLRYSYSDEELKSVVPSGIIDSAGLRVYRSRHTVDRGSGEQDSGQFDRAEPVFGLSGACTLFRRQALESIRFRDEYFDEDFFAYKDDIDIAWRLLRLDWVNWYEGTMVGYHHRSIQGQSKNSNKQIVKNFQRRAIFNAAYSYRNHWLLFMKNESSISLRPDLPWILWYEFRKIVFLLATRPAALGGVYRAMRLRSTMKAKAVLLNHVAKQTAGAIRNQWIAQS